MMMKVPLLDLRKQYRTIRGQIQREIRRVLETQELILGPEVERFEEEVAGFCRIPHAVGVSSGSDALLISLMALGVGNGDSVVTSAYTFFATGGCISRLGATPVFVDIDPKTYNLDPNRLEDYLKRIRKKRDYPKVLMPVHLFGQMADMTAMMRLARKYEMRVVEDAAQAIGAREKRGQSGRNPKEKEWIAGTVGDLGCFSFYPTKNLGGAGEGGMVITKDPALADKIRILRNHGMYPRYHHQMIGLNSRLDALQAAVLRVKLRYLKNWTEGRRTNAARYRSGFAESGLDSSRVLLPVERKGAHHIYNQFVIAVKNRDSLRRHLSQMGIGSEIYYPIPLHLQECYRNLGYRDGDFPESEKAARETLALPIYPELTAAQQSYVIKTIKKFFTTENTERTEKNRRTIQITAKLPKAVARYPGGDGDASGNG
jgi:dTDP-4-amino-4,6-dideoxygalactose transaminase